MRACESVFSVSAANISVLSRSSSNIIGDSDALWKYVNDLYPSQRPLLFAHSLGTGPASALLEKYGGNDAGGEKE